MKYAAIFTMLVMLSACRDERQDELAVARHIVNQFCDPRGGIKRDLSDYEVSPDEFRIECADGSRVSGYVGEPALTIFRSRSGLEIRNPR